MRIEYPDAYYHVMNRGAGRRNIFHDEDYFEAFLKTLSEAHDRFGIEILSYCLMNNHYHLLLKTPEANLGRAMRHINGVYTQRHNRMRKTDGPLFRGRYKAICVEKDSYQLQLSRYIHRNPIEAKKVKALEDYPWSSYSYFVSNEKPPAWLYLDDIHNQLSGKIKKRAKYKAFVELGIDEKIQQFYGKGNVQSYLGGDDFRKWVYERRNDDTSFVSKKELKLFRPSLEEVVEAVAASFKVEVASILANKRGRVPDNIPRWAAFYLVRDCCGLTLKDMAEGFGLKSIGSISTTINKLQDVMAEDKALSRKVLSIKREYDR